MTSYTTISGDTWDMIAFKAYGNEMYTDDLMNANTDYLETSVFTGGVKLTIPVIEEQEKIIPPWGK